MSEPPISPATSSGPELEPGERLLTEAAGVRLGWQWRTVLIWWVPGLVLLALAWLEFRSLVVTLALAAFCLALFAFYASDREVRPRRAARRYLLTDRRLLTDTGSGWRDVPLVEVARTRMEEGVADRAVAGLSAAATIVLELRGPGPKGEPRRTRIGPMRNPVQFRAAIDAQLKG